MDISPLMTKKTVKRILLVRKKLCDFFITQRLINNIIKYY